MTWVASSTRTPSSARELVTTSPSGGLARGSITGSATDDAAEQAPPFTVETLQLHLTYRAEIGGAGVDENSGQHHRQLHILEVGGLSHHVFPTQIVAALLQHLHLGLGSPVAVHIETVGDVGGGIVILHPVQPILVARI